MGKSKNVTTWTILGIVGIIIIIAIGISGNKPQDTNDGDKAMDSLRKCTVMEAADLYNTSTGENTENVFDKAKETCLSWSKQWGEESFIETVSTDWESRKNEQIDGNSLEYFLSTLNW